MRDHAQSSIKLDSGVVVATGILTWLVFFLYSPVTDSLDWQNYYRGNFHFLTTTLRAGEFPWWNPHIGLGRPFAPDIQNAIWYPGTYLLLLGETPGLFLLIWIHLALASIGTMRVATEFGAERLWATFAGLVFALSGPVGIRLFPGQMFFVFGLCHLPWVFLFTYRLLHKPNEHHAGWLTLFLCLQFFAGHPQACWITIAGLGFFVAIHLGTEWFTQSEMPISRPLCLLAVAGVLTALITAIGWLPMLDLIAHGNRAAANINYSSFGQIGWTQLFGWITRPPMKFPLNWEMNSFVGFTWTVPFLLGVFLIRDRPIRILIATGFLLLCFAFGTSSIVFHICFNLVPGASSFRLPGRMLIWPVFVCVIVSAVVLSRAPKNGLPIPLITIVTTIGIAALALRFPQETHDGGSLGLIPPTLLLAMGIAATCLVWRFNQQGKRSTLPTVILIAATGIEFGLALHHYRGTYEVGNFVGHKIDATEVARVKDTIESLSTNRESPVPIRANLPTRIIPANHATIHGFHSVDAYTSLFLQRPWIALHQLTGTPEAVFRNSGLGDAFYAGHPVAVPSVSIDFGVQPGSDNFIINSNSLPRAWFSHVNVSVPDTASAVELVRSGFPFPTATVVEQPTSTPITLPPNAGMTPVKIESYSHSSVSIKVNAPCAGHLILNDAWFPGWTAKIGAKQIDTVPVNIWMRGVPLTAGEQVVRLQFRPRNWVTALSLTLLGLILCFFWCFEGHRSKSA